MQMIDGKLVYSTESMTAQPPPPPPPPEEKPKRRRRTKKRKAQKVVRGGALKRHPSRPPVKKRVVKTKKVAMQGHEDGPLGEIMGRDGDTLYIQWPGKDRLMSHNARYMVSVDDKEEE